MRKIEFIALHHTGSTQSNPNASTQDMTWEQVDAVHRDKYKAYANTWSAYKSILGHWGGYNFFIDKTGAIKQLRAIGEETAAQTGSNFNTVSICLAGNFSTTVEHPTPFQITAMTVLIRNILNKNLSEYAVMVGTEISIPFSNIKPHRLFSGANTQCYGNYLDDSWARDRLIGHYVSLIEKLKVWLQELKASLTSQKLGGETNCFHRDERG